MGKIKSYPQSTTCADADVLIKEDATGTKFITFSNLFSSIKAKLGLGTASTKGVVNNLTTTEDGSVLDARQGKALKEKVDGKADADHKHDPQSSVIGNAGTATKLQCNRRIDGVSFDGSADVGRFCICSTAASEIEKNVTLTGLDMVSGAIIVVKFTYGNTAARATLNVNGVGGKTIYYKGAALVAGFVRVNELVELVYDGTFFNVVGDCGLESRIESISTDLTKIDGNLQTLNGMYSAKCIATACMSVADSSAKYSAVKIPLNDFRVLGTLLTSFNGGVKIGKGISTVLVNGNMFFTTASATQQVWIRITKNGIEQAIALDSTTTNFTSCQITNMMLSVKEGDLLEIVKINADLDTVRAGGNSYLTVIAY